MAKWIYGFGDGGAEGSLADRELLGGKGANLAQMCHLGLPVPPGFTITTQVCHYYWHHEHCLPPELMNEIRIYLERVGTLTGRGFGDIQNPLLLAVRSGARVSMPGMMDTVLNLGLNDETVKTLARQAGERFAYDSYRRFIQMYGDVVLGVDHDIFETLLDEARRQKGYDSDTQMSTQDWQSLTQSYKRAIEEELEQPFPQNPEEQLICAIGAVFSSWATPRAVLYRQIHNIPEDWGTAVTVQAMVFGNMGDDCATGVAFTRNPSTGDKELYGEFLVNAQGEDVVAGIRTPQNITEQARIAAGSHAPSLEKLMPEAFATLRTIADQLEQHYLDMQDLEFTIERGKLWMLQTRSGKRTSRAALKIATDQVKCGLIDKREAIVRIEPASLDQLLHPTINPEAERHLLCSGLAASPGAATGEIVFSSEEAQQAHIQGRKVILVRVETSPEDIHGMYAAQGILTSRGGMTSHAAVVARGMGKPCISGAGQMRIDYRIGTLTIGAEILKAGDVITLDGGSGQVFKGAVTLMQPELPDDFVQIMAWADEIATDKKEGGYGGMEVRANAETPHDARQARSFGARGIGLCRSEHMFFAPERIAAMRQMILAEDEVNRRQALMILLPMQRADFIDLFTIMQGFPVTIRLLDPPLHEFLPKTAVELAQLAVQMGVEVNELETRARALHEVNPMLGLRGCRLAITYPEIVEMQVRAIFEAAIEAAQITGEAIIPEIMVPLVAMKTEFDYVKAQIDKTAHLVMEEKNKQLNYQVGTMIELPRAALMAQEIAQSADFFSFGTNDLTQTTFGISRDDAGSYLTHYRQKGLVTDDPFISLDREGVGELVALAVERGRKSRPGLKMGLCGEHGGDSASIAFCVKQGLDYVSCSPFRVPIARLAIAQAVIKSRNHQN